MGAIRAYTNSPGEAAAFGRDSRHSWQRNTEYWLNCPLRHVEDTRAYLRSKLTGMLAPRMDIVDMGCGSGWVLELILERNVPVSYVGLDFNPRFVTHLEGAYGHLSNVSFMNVDLSEPIPASLVGSADLAFNCFNFFEILNLEVAFGNAARMLRPGGRLVILTIECVYLILAMGRSPGDLRVNLTAYEEIKAAGHTPYFFQQIDLGESESEDLQYPSVLHSLDDFFRRASVHDMDLVDYGEVIKTSKVLPKTYQFITFRRQDR